MKSDTAMKSDIARLLVLARDIGFEEARIRQSPALTPNPQVRAMCAADRCRAYGKNHACPPACGSMADCRLRLERYDACLLVQTVGKLSDAFDPDGLARASEVHRRRFDTLARQARLLQGDVLPLAAGPCTRCYACAYPGPCRFPDKRLSSMEAYGLLVSDVCQAAGIPYNHGENTVTFTSCVLFCAGADGAAAGQPIPGEA